MSTPEEVAGVMCWMSPERIECETYRRLEKPDDVYAFGCLMYMVSRLDSFPTRTSEF
jgi:hypothetical protein